MIVLDTNVISELMRATPDRGVVQFLDRLDRRAVRTTAISVAEIRLGIARLPRGRRRTLLADMADELFAAVLWGKILPFDEGAATTYARIAARRSERGRPIALADALIAGICLQHDATLATRNVKDFESTGIRLVDPWEALVD
jgi:hypothetical protein